MSINKTPEWKFINRKLQKLRNECQVRRKLDFDITTEQVMDLLEKQKYKCALSGDILEFTIGGNLDGKNPNGLSIDRIDNSRGYFLDNIQLTTILTNLLRNKMLCDSFINHCKKIALYNS